MIVWATTRTTTLSRNRKVYEIVVYAGGKKTKKIQRPEVIYGWIWNPPGGTSQWIYRAELGGRTYPEGSKFYPITELGNPTTC